MRSLLRVAGNTDALSRATTSQGHQGLNKLKASVFRHWPVTAPYRGEQTIRFEGGMIKRKNCFLGENVNYENNIAK